MSNARLVAAASLIFLVSGCNTTGTMTVPKVASANVTNVEAPIHEQATFALSKVVTNIRRGTVIAHFPAVPVEGTDGYLCNYRYGPDATMEWTSGISRLGDWSTVLGEIFYETLSQRGLNIAGDPRSLFEREEAVSSAEYLIGGRIAEIRGNFCESHHWWNGHPLDRYSGEMYMSVEWTVFSSLLQREILQIETVGYHKQKESIKNGIRLTFHNAFAAATEGILESEDFRKISNRTYNIENETENAEELQIVQTPLLKKTIDENLDQILPSVVTLRVGSGHGSGFVIANNGLVLTNHHVVGEAKTVSVILNNGLELEGQVLRTNSQRDVALVKAPLRVPFALAIRPNKAQPLEKVYVIGTPLQVGLSSTVTTGIVSAVRKDADTGLSFIQADAAISPGNSGGPLLDQNGNVLGISVLKYRRGEALNLFIPIAEALKALNVRSNTPGS